MPMPLQEQDYYIGLTEVPSMENSERVVLSEGKGLNLKATELRLGLPGSESPERDGGGLKGLVSGAKRGFSDTMDGGGSGKWVFSSGGGSEVDLAKNGGLFSPRGCGSEGSDGTHHHSAMASKEAVAVPPQLPKPVTEKIKPQISNAQGQGINPSSKAQVVGWPPIRSFRKNSMASNTQKTGDDVDAKLGSSCLYVKVSMDGAPYLRKVDLKNYTSYMELSSALEKMFSCFTIGQYGSHGVSGRDGLSESGLKDLLHGSEYVLTYEDKDGDWMLVGDVPWKMFTDSCKRLRIMKSSDAIGLAPRTMEKCKNRN